VEVGTDDIWAQHIAEQPHELLNLIHCASVSPVVRADCTALTEVASCSNVPPSRSGRHVALRPIFKRCAARIRKPPHEDYATGLKACEPSGVHASRLQRRCESPVRSTGTVDGGCGERSLAQIVKGLTKRELADIGPGSTVLST
jgi:hypothetical protein